jgi:hypothetical protein
MFSQRFVKGPKVVQVGVGPLPKILKLGEFLHSTLRLTWELGCFLLNTICWANLYFIGTFQFIIINNHNISNNVPILTGSWPIG